MTWLYSGSGVKSSGEVDRLVNNVILADDFNRDDFIGFSAKPELTRLDKHTDTTEESFPAADGWRRTSVTLHLPKTRVKHESEASAPSFEVPGVVYRPFLAAIRAAYEDPTALLLHNTPFQLLFSPPTNAASAPADDAPAPPIPVNPNPPERLYSELYNTDALNRADTAVQQKAREDREPGDDASIVYAVAGIMLYSDSTHLTNFGMASLWPIYFWLASLSKYIRAAPNTFATHHLAYIPGLPELVKMAYEHAYGVAPTPAVLRFCKRELMQQIWLLLLDDEFMQAYVHGFIVKCGDGITRRLFPRLLAYSADYPEKCLIACIKYLGRCPCPDCLVEKDKIHLMGTKRDMAMRQNKRREDTPWLQRMLVRIRGWIFNRGLATEGKAIEAVLNATSTSPNQSAFSRRLAKYGFDIYRMLVPDVMHEIELGTWKATMTHLVRILTCIGPSAVNELNIRYIYLVVNSPLGTDTTMSPDLPQSLRLAVIQFAALAPMLLR
ncbi:hypothetical protein C2E23DRAFT_744396 [Lenzites betulinus]|nr:hypothetical protein C2E23DRAFT_744396 [Lenzites betulinus]